MAMDGFLSNAIAMLQTRRSLTTDQAEALSIGVEIPSLQAEQAKVRADMAAFLAEKSAITPPLESDYQAIQNQSAQLDGLTAASTKAGAIIDLAAAALKVWNSTRA
jgi:hypothetical protein